MAAGTGAAPGTPGYPGRRGGIEIGRLRSAELGKRRRVTLASRRDKGGPRHSRPTLDRSFLPVNESGSLLHERQMF